MSDNDNDESPNKDKIDQASSCPHYSQVDSTINLTPPPHNTHLEQDYESTPTTTLPDRYGCQTSSPNFGTTNEGVVSVDQNIVRRGAVNDIGLSGPAPYKGMLTECSGALLVEEGPRTKGGKFLAPPLHTTPRGYNTCEPSEGGYKLEGEENATVLHINYIPPNPGMDKTRILGDKTRELKSIAIIN